MRILIAEDEVSIAKALKVILEKNKYAVDMVHNGLDAVEYLSTIDYDTVVLDIMMPGLDGLGVLKKARAQGNKVQILLLTAKSEVEDKILGLETGADDYLSKPFDTGEFLARIKALTRRNVAYTDSLVTFGDITLDKNRYTISTKNKSITLNNKEFQLMEFFIQNPNHVFSTEYLMDKIWGIDSDSNIEVVWTHIGFVRRKLKELEANVEIRTIRGAGYSLEVL